MVKKEMIEIVSLKLFLYFVIFVVVGLAMANFFNACCETVGIEKDNFVEEIFEDLIEYNTGFKQDLTP